MKISLIPLFAGLALASFLIVSAGANPGSAFWHLIEAGFGCQAAGARCALLTAWQFSAPLLFSGLAATVAFRAGFFSLGQFGQLLLGGAAAAWTGAFLAELPFASFPPPFQALAALAAGVLLGALWGLVPAILKEWLAIHEVLSTIVLNQIAFILVTSLWLPRVALSARLLPLVQGTKLSAGVLIALLSAFVIALYLGRSASGYGQRMAGQARRFAGYGGIATRPAILRALLISGGLAGLGGAVEVLGVHYRFVTSFSAVGVFDGVIVALLGQLHPLGVVPAALFLGGIRLGAINGLQLQAGVPRELGGVLIALMVLFIAAWRASSGAGRIGNS